MLIDEMETKFVPSHHQQCWNSQQSSAAMRDFVYFAGPDFPLDLFPPFLLSEVKLFLQFFFFFKST